MDEHIIDEIVANKIYARPGADGMVIDFLSTAFKQPQPDDILVEEGHEYHHAHVYAKYQPTDDHGRYNYRIADGVIEAIPEEDKPPILEPVVLPTVQELSAENKLLRNQVEALSDQNDFQEELIVELANIVYA